MRGLCAVHALLLAGGDEPDYDWITIWGIAQFDLDLTEEQSRALFSGQPRGDALTHAFGLSAGGLDGISELSRWVVSLDTGELIESVPGMAFPHAGFSDFWRRTGGPSRPILRTRTWVYSAQSLTITAP